MCHARLQSFAANGLRWLASSFGYTVARRFGTLDPR
jgi:hypothetical protein